MFTFDPTSYRACMNRSALGTNIGSRVHLHFRFFCHKMQNTNHPLDFVVSATIDRQKL